MPNLKILWKQLLSPAVARLRGLKDMYLDYYWRGVYARLSEVPAAGPGFAGDHWLDITTRTTAAMQQAAATGGLVPWFVAGDRALLPLLAASLGADGKRLVILDFGGGMGLDFIHVGASLTEDWDIDYHLVESPGVCQVGKLLWPKAAKIHFHSTLPENLQADIVFSRSSLQYVKDYAGLLRRLAGCRPRFLLLADLPAGDIPTYATGQYNLRGSILPYWFFNFQELIDILDTSGYRPVFRSRQEGSYDRDNFPPSHRLEYMCNVLFARRQDGE